LGPLAAGADTFAGAIPTILKMNSANSLSRQKENADQAVTSSVDDALRLGCAAIGFTIYPGSDTMYDQYEEFRDLSAEAKAKGLAVVLWSYPRGGELTKEAELAVDVIGYAAHMAALLGANIIKVKLPSDFLGNKDSKKVYEDKKISIATQAERVKHIMQCSFAGRRIVVFSGGAAKGEDSVIQDARDIHAGGGNGSIIGRNCFQRPREDAMKLLDQLIEIYKGKA
jgi:class I fructose-bisphosphate aldolase